MRVAALCDIHGNLPALEAVLAEVDREGVSTIVVGGDTVSGPWPAEVHDLLEHLGARIVRGNADRLVLEGGEGGWRSGPPSASAPDGYPRLGAWPLTLELEIDGLGHVLVCHASPSSDETLYTRATPDAAVAELLGPVAADVVVCGHTHAQYDRVLSTGLRVVNPGSVGLPYEGRRGRSGRSSAPTSSFATPRTTSMPRRRPSGRSALPSTSACSSSSSTRSTPIRQPQSSRGSVRRSYVREARRRGLGRGASGSSRSSSASPRSTPMRRSRSASAPTWSSSSP